MKYLMKRLLLTLTIFVAMAESASAQMLALKTNVIGDAMCAPNMEVELVTGNKTSVTLEMVYGCTPYFDKKFKGFAVLPEFRYWFFGRPMTKMFIGGSLMGAAYKTNGARKIYKGNVGGIGLTFGYVWGLGKKKDWNIEATTGLGLYRYHQLERISSSGIPMDYYGSSGIHFTEDGWSLLPYKFGVSVSYIIPTHLKTK